MSACVAGGTGYIPSRTGASRLCWWLPSPRRSRHADEAGDYRGLPLLADALEEAGCTDADLLAHCRSGGGHLRGCWAVDLILGKG
jgi:hypothetical protein